MPQHRLGASEEHVMNRDQADSVRPKKFTELMQEYVQTNLPGRLFTMYDIRMTGKTNKIISGALQCLERRNILIRDGKIINECGKDSPVYKLSENAPTINKAGSKSTTDYRRVLAEQEATMNECAVRLHRVLDNIERRNAHHA